MAEETTVDAAQDNNEAATMRNTESNPAPAAGTERRDRIDDPLNSFVKEKAGGDEDGKVGDGGLMGVEETTPEAGEKKDAAEPDGENAPRYEAFAIPDGFVEDAETMTQVREIAHKHGLKQEQAQDWVNAYFEVEKKKTAEQTEALARNNAEWLKEIKGHPEFGGANLGAGSEQVGAAIRRFGSPRLAAEMRQMNLQNWPEMYFFVGRMAKALAEDSSPGGEKGRKELSPKDFFEIGE